MRVCQNFDTPSPVRLIGLEPTRPKSPDPKSGASANFATSAIRFAAAKVQNKVINRKQKNHELN